MALEIDYKLGVDTEGVIVSDEDHALAVRVSEWLDTPKGEMWGAPQWGNNLKQYRHLPICGDTEAAIENSIILSLPADVQGVVISDISVTETDTDQYFIQIALSSGAIVRNEVNLK